VPGVFLSRRDEISSLRRQLWRRALMQDDLCRAGILVALATRHGRNAGRDAALTFAVDCTIIGLPEPRSAVVDLLLQRRWSGARIERVVRKELVLRARGAAGPADERPARTRAVAAPRDAGLVLGAANEAFWCADFEDAVAWASAGLLLPDESRSEIQTVAMRRVLAHAQRRVGDEERR